MIRIAQPYVEGLYRFWCPGCDSSHGVNKNVWHVDLDTETITPSVLVWSHKKLINEDLEGDALTAPENVMTTPRCHSFVTNGRIQFLDDSTHALAGQTVDLPEWTSDKS